MLFTLTRSRHSHLCLALLAVALLLSPLPLWGWETRGSVSLEGVDYLFDRNKDRRDEQAVFHLDLRLKHSLDENFSVTFRPEIYYEFTKDRILRYEPLEGYVDYESSSWDFRFGQVLESWAITDTFNPVDILNRRDLERNLLRASKLGEVMLRFRYFLPDGDSISNQTASFYVLPLFRETLFPKGDDPYSFERGGGRVQDRDGIAPKGVNQMGFAVRYSASWESMDFFLLGYHGVTRYPIFQFERVRGGLFFRPVYYLVDKAGGGFQWAMGDWLMKLELVRTWPNGKHLGSSLSQETRIPEPFTQYVVGFDHSFYDLGLDNSTLTWTLEYSGEDKSTNTPGESRPFKSDFFTQFRYEFGNISQMVLSLNLAYDIMIGESITDLIFEWKPSRDFENLKLIFQAEYQKAARNEENSFLRFFPNNSFVSMKTEWSF